MELSSVMGLVLMTHQKVRKDMLAWDSVQELKPPIQVSWEGELEFMDIVVSYSYLIIDAPAPLNVELRLWRACPDGVWSFQVMGTETSAWSLMQLHWLSEIEILNFFKVNVLEGEALFMRDLSILTLVMP